MGSSKLTAAHPGAALRWSSGIRGRDAKWRGLLVGVQHQEREVVVAHLREGLEEAQEAASVAVAAQGSGTRLAFH